MAGRTSSLSRNARKRPRAASIPVLRALPSPPLRWLRRRKRPSRAAYLCAMAALESVEPSSTMTTSRSPKVCATMESRHSSRYRSTL